MTITSVPFKDRKEAQITQTYSVSHLGLMQPRNNLTVSHTSI